MSASDHLNPVQFFHTTPAVLQPGDMVEPGHPGMSDSVQRKKDRGKYVYAGTTPNEFRTFYRPHSYHVEPTGPMTDDPFSPGFRSRHPMRVVGQVSREEGEHDRWYEDDYDDAVEKLRRY